MRDVRKSTLDAQTDHLGRAQSVNRVICAYKRVSDHYLTNYMIGSIILSEDPDRVAHHSDAQPASVSHRLVSETIKESKLGDTDD
jgi:hypothetical protein